MGRVDIRKSTICLSTNVEKVEVMWSDWKIYERTPCEIYTRCMGYIRPMSWRNIWKKAEGMSRKYFTEERVNNSDFLAKYMTAKTVEN